MVAAFVDPMSMSAAQAYDGVLPHSPRLLDRSAANSLVSMPWELVSVHGRTITIVAAGGDGSCTVPAGLRVSETSSRVTVGSYSRNAHDDAVCADLVQMRLYAVTLKRPIGSRELVHVASDSTWKLG